MSAIDRFASATANPLLVLSRLVIGLFLVWLGLTKIIPGWAPFEGDAQLLMSTMTQGKLDGQIGIWLIGGWQVIAGLALCILPALRLAIILLWLQLALFGVVVAFHLSALHDGSGLPTLFAHMMLRNAVITFVGLAIASHSVMVFGPAKPRKG
jgi:hypothetical protein